MNKRFLFSALFLSGLMLAVPSSLAQERDRVAGDFRRADADGDKKLSPLEWRRRGNFSLLDTDGDGVLSLPEVRVMYEGHSDRSYVWPPPGFRRSAAGRDLTAETDRVNPYDVDGVTWCAIARTHKCGVEPAVNHGLFETGLGPVFPDRAVCPGIDDYYALDYSHKRSRVSYHGGIDIPVRWGTPIVAAAAGTVVGVFEGARSKRGIEILLRHAPEDSGLPFWVYTGYGHLDRLPELKVGDRVAMGELLGPTGNSGLGSMGGSITRRRPAIHFSAFFSTSRRYASQEEIIVPVGGQWADPIALYRGMPPIDSEAMRTLPEAEKDVPVAVMFEDGTFSSPNAKFIWPYLCARK